MAFAGRMPRFAFRGCSVDTSRDDTNGIGILPRNPSAHTSPQAAIENGHSPSCFVHMSTSGVTAAYYATRMATQDGRVVKIDLAHPSICQEVVNVSTQEGARHYGLEVGSDAYRFAVLHREVLVRGMVPAAAIVSVYELSAQDFDYGQRRASMEIFRAAMPKAIEDQIVTEWYGVETFFVDGTESFYHFSRSCPLCDIEADAVETEDGPSIALRACHRCLMRGTGEMLPQRATQNQTSTTRMITQAYEVPMPKMLDQLYFTTATGKKFHLQEDCDGLRNARRVFSQSARPLHLAPCSLCAV